jgi:Spy/CpxP family protein refolding chaperone
MKLSAKRIVILILGTATVSTLVACGHHFSSPEERAEYMVDKVSKELTLNDAQNVKLNTLKDELLAARQEMISKRKETKQAINELLEQPALDRDRVLNMVSEHTQAVNDKAPQIVSALGDFYDSLTAEQQAKLREKVKERMEHHGKYWRH